MPQIDSPSRDPRESRFAKDHPKAYLLIHAAGGIVLVALLLWAFAVLADEIPEQGWMIGFDHSVTGLAARRGTEWGETIFAVVSLFGAPILATLIALMACLYALRRDWLRAAALVIGAGGGVAVCTMLKHIFHRGRPDMASEFITHQTWSFPSGHAFTSLVGYGLLLALSSSHRNDWRYRALVIAVVLLIGISRVYLTVHYLSDVVAGWLAGAIWLYVCITGYRFARRSEPGSTSSHARV